MATGKWERETGTGKIGKGTGLEIGEDAGVGLNEQIRMIRSHLFSKPKPIKPNKIPCNLHRTYGGGRDGRTIKYQRHKLQRIETT